MGKDVKADLKRLRKEFLEAEQANRKEKDCLLNLVNTFGFVVSEREELAEEYRAIKALINNEKALPLEPIREATGSLRAKIFVPRRQRPGRSRATLVRPRRTRF